MKEGLRENEAERIYEEMSAEMFRTFRDTNRDI